MLLNDMPFSHPFVIRMQCGLERKFLNVYDTLDFLENEWPMRDGASYQVAVMACREALSGTGSILVARTALIEACAEAGFVPLADQGTERAGIKAA